MGEGAAPPDQATQVAQALAQNPGAKGMDLAAKMMEKMGWKSGLGLGRNKQVSNPAMQGVMLAARLLAPEQCSQISV